MASLLVGGPLWTNCRDFVASEHLKSCQSKCLGLALLFSLGKDLLRYVWGYFDYFSPVPREEGHAFYNSEDFYPFDAFPPYARGLLRALSMDVVHGLASLSHGIRAAGLKELIGGMVAAFFLILAEDTFRDGAGRKCWHGCKHQKTRSDDSCHSVPSVPGFPSENDHRTPEPLRSSQGTTPVSECIYGISATRRALWRG